MLWLLPVFIKTLLYLFGCPVGGVLSLFSNVIYSVFLLCIIPAYFLYAGPEAAVRLSLLLCVHSLLLGMIPRIVKLIVPMVELVLFISLLFLPINVTPPIAVWFYEKLLYLSSPILSVFEAINIVLIIMKGSQMVVDQIEEHPNVVKSVILGVATVATVLGSLLSHYIYTVYSSHSINRIIEVLVVISLILLVLSLVKDEGIISEVPCIFFVMMCVVWALAKESVS
ncbi:uncharacterized protein LOC114520343 isoform X1 [Dendronephthya gigantea]|uniref:uncharacterized protein LOC114520343 isoform X1 n=1 Tax=Dendronephthya gigantea TaxID=151771 RepID=UPI00106CEE0C|nr:uncharacterized protein LOC114520343 isoform X1 [Dendronephthya gigantea]